MRTVFQTDFKDLVLAGRGKVRDIYDLGDSLLIVATDRLSAFDVVLPDPIPRKGEVLTKISRFWFDRLKDVIDNHIISTDIDKYPEICLKYKSDIEGRSMLVKKAKPLPIECIVRGYISGSGWKDYQKTGKISGIMLPAGLLESQKLPEPIFTPTTKEEVGTHDQTIDFEETKKMTGPDIAEKVRSAAVALYKKASLIADKKGIIIADTKFEFGLFNGKLILIDEALTPDSSRFWPKDDYAIGRGQKSFDKQYVRDYLLSIKWDQKPPAPKLPEEVIKRTSEKYVEALEKLTA
ncbi:MAG: phosphoribosylaminoimidazolesuccinocarboxamide synthase [Candidatus Margulisiibacteriota bacterium]